MAGFGVDEDSGVVLDFNHIVFDILLFLQVKSALFDEGLCKDISNIFWGQLVPCYEKPLCDGFDHVLPILI